MMVWLIQPWMQRRGIPVAWFGPIWAAVLVVAGYALLAMRDTPWAVAAYLCFMTTRDLQSTLLANVIQADAPHEDRASVLSLNALCFRLAFVVCGPAVGALVDRFTLEPTLAGLAVVSAVASPGALVTFRRAHTGIS